MRALLFNIAFCTANLIAHGKKDKYIKNIVAGNLSFVLFYDSV